MYSCDFLLIALVIFRYCVPLSVSSTEFYPTPPYEAVYLENQAFSVETEDRVKADRLASAFLANLQKEHDVSYQALLDGEGIKYRKREEMEERRPIYLRELRRLALDEANPYCRKGEKVLNDRQLQDFYQDPQTPPNVQVSNYIFEQNPKTRGYRFFRQLTDHQVFLGICFLVIVVLSILLWPSFREMGILSVLNIE